MTSAKSVGRTAAIVSLPRMFITPALNFWLLPGATAINSLQSAVAAGTAVRAGLLLSFVSIALGLAFVVIVYPLLRRYSERLAVALLMASMAGLVMILLEDFAVFRMLALSEQHATVPGARPMIEAVIDPARATWRWTHYANLLSGQATALVFAVILYRFALVPRLLAGLAIVTIILAIGALALPLLGRPFPMWTLTPMGLVQLALLLWLLVRGFTERPLDRAAA